jgi:glycosyltransferase involved in cell wall biosynthesis
MSKPSYELISIVVPIYNEALGLEKFHKSLLKILDKDLTDKYELIYCDDGSTDKSPDLIRSLHNINPRVKLLRLSRNFGKENVLSAGITAARGEAIITLDGDGQHPVQAIPQFITAWEQGAKVVIGVRRSDRHNSWFKRSSSRLFHLLFNRLSEQQLKPGSTDFRLIDKSVQKVFISMPETDRLTRGLIDWLGFKREYIYFTTQPREYGTPSYSYLKLLKLAVNSFVSLSPVPLYLFGFLGVVITILAFLLGGTVLIEQLIIGDPLHWRVTGSAMLGILILFLVGLVLISQGIMSLYISHIHNQSKQRPLFVINYDESVGINQAPDHS